MSQESSLEFDYVNRFYVVHGREPKWIPSITLPSGRRLWYRNPNVDFIEQPENFYEPPEVDFGE